MVANKRKVMILMSRKNWQRKDLVSAMGSTPATVSHILNGIPVKMTTFKKCADALGVDVEEIVADVF